MSTNSVSNALRNFSNKVDGDQSKLGEQVGNAASNVIGNIIKAAPDAFYTGLGGAGVYAAGQLGYAEISGTKQNLLGLMNYDGAKTGDIFTIAGLTAAVAGGAGSAMFAIKHGARALATLTDSVNKV